MLILIIIAVFIVITRGDKNSEKDFKILSPTISSIKSFISTTGTIEPQNRLEIKPPINGRIEEIKVREGQKVRSGDILALMSSTERAALLDAARAQGQESLDYWEQVYNPTPLIAPISGEVIVRAVEPGQTIASTDAVVVLSDRLIIKANVDEVDIGKVKVGQKAMISLDAYPEIKVDGVVDHISYESTLVSNVTIYEVDILPEKIPEVFRSGMSANVDIVYKNKENILIVPLEAVERDSNGNIVYISQNGSKKPIARKVELGISDGENIEVISGLEIEDKILITMQKYLFLQDSSTGRNPFMPNFREKKK